MSVMPVGPGVDFTVATPALSPPAAAPNVPFAGLLTNLIQESQSHQSGVGVELQRIVSGEADGVHDLVTQMAQADLSFRLVMEIRDRLIASYHELMRMQI